MTKLHIFFHPVLWLTHLFVIVSVRCLSSSRWRLLWISIFHLGWYYSLQDIVWPNSLLFVAFEMALPNRWCPSSFSNPCSSLTHIFTNSLHKLLTGNVSPGSFKNHPFERLIWFLGRLNSRKISTKLAVNLGHPVSAPESGTVLEFSPNESGDTAVWYKKIIVRTLYRCRYVYSSF